MGIIQKEDVATLLRENDVCEEIIEGLLAHPPLVNSLALETAKALAAELNKDSDFRAKVLKAATTDQGFKKQLLNKMMDQLT